MGSGRMADVQIDNGDFTRVANQILKNIAKAKLNGTQYSVVLTIWRNTYGFQKIEGQFSLGYLAKETGIHKNQIQPELAKLIERNIITVTKEATWSTPQILKFNKDYDQWKGLVKTLTVKENTNRTVSENTNRGISESTNQGKKDVKEIIKEIVPYKEIIDHLNLVCNKYYKHTTDMTKKHIHTRWTEGHRLEQFKTVIDNKAASWIGTDMEKFLRPETLFGTKFEGYLNEKPNPPPKQKRVLML